MILVAWPAVLLVLFALLVRLTSRRPATLLLNPRYRELLAEQGLAKPEEFLSLPLVIVSGHPDRHVGEVHVGPLRCFLKRELRIPWRDRLAAARAGFGPVSKSEREARTLQAMQDAGIGCADWIAAGEDGTGRAFLLLAEVPGAIDLRLFVRDQLPGNTEARGQFAQALGRAIARLHDAGFDHPDLSAKHVVLDHRGEVVFLDCQRVQRRPRGWDWRLRNLAVLDATLSPDLVNPRERLVCLRAYLGGKRPKTARKLIAFISRESRRLQQRRHIREQLCPPLPAGKQNLIWLDGEALCVTREFWSVLGERVPDWLRALPDRNCVTERCVLTPEHREALLTQRCESRLFAWLWAKLRRRPFTSPELRKAGTLFRLQRQGVPTPTLLAVGQRHRLWRTESFLLTDTRPEPAEERAS